MAMIDNIMHTAVNLDLTYEEFLSLFYSNLEQMDAVDIFAFALVKGILESYIEKKKEQ